MLNLAITEKENQLKEIFNALKYHKLELIYEGGINKFYIKNKQGRIIRLLRSFHDSNFDPESEFYSSSDDKINKIKSDYNYILNLRLDC